LIRLFSEGTKPQKAKIEPEVILKCANCKGEIYKHSVYPFDCLHCKSRFYYGGRGLLQLIEGLEFFGLGEEMFQDERVVIKVDGRKRNRYSPRGTMLRDINRERGPYGVLSE